jgi:ppGpp synthetase/RelA/SpoT-type nucleotidyltranferase
MEMENTPTEYGEDVAESVTTPQSEVAEFDLTLQEFCMRLSNIDKRVELIGGFEHSERVAGRAKDTESAYRQRYTAFINRPA